MKIASCFLYVLFTLMYTAYTGSNTIYVYGFGMLTILLFTSVVCLFQLPAHNKKNTESENLFFQFALYLTLGRSAYTLACLFSNAVWIKYHTLVFNWLTGICFVVLLIYCAFKRS